MDSILHRRTGRRTASGIYDLRYRRLPEPLSPTVFTPGINPAAYRLSQTMLRYFRDGMIDA